MKKLMCAVAAMAAGAAMAVESGVVGYQTDGLSTEADGLPTQLNMISIPFTQVNGEGLKFSDLKFENLLANTDYTLADLFEIWLPDIGGYYTFYYYNSGDEDDGWWTVDEFMFDELYPNGLPVGTAMWCEARCDNEELGITREGPLQITYAGAVADDADVTFTLVNEAEGLPTVLNMVANPFPIAWKLGDPTTGADVQFENILANTDYTLADLIEIWLPEIGGYYTFYYYNSGDEDEGWWTVDEFRFEELYPDGIPSGTPFWFELRSTESGLTREGTPKIKFISPINRAE